MARFQKTTLHVVSAVAILLGLYATAGLIHALWIHAAEAATPWAIIAGLSFLAAFAWQAWTAKKRRRTP